MLLIPTIRNFVADLSTDLHTMARNPYEALAWYRHSVTCPLQRKRWSGDTIVQPGLSGPPRFFIGHPAWHAPSVCTRTKWNNHCTDVIIKTFRQIHVDKYSRYLYICSDRFSDKFGELQAINLHFQYKSALSA